MSGEASPRIRRVATGLGLSAACLLFAAAGGLLSPGDWLRAAQSKTIFPVVVLAGAILCGLLIAAGAARNSDTPFATAGLLKAVGIGALAAIYAIALPRVGFLIATTALSVLLPVLLGYRNIVAIAAFTIAILALVWLVFIRLMNVPLPL
ncbi:tripartite tricarboxylate transporter TctB family protein [Acuticoccus mangrovi]|uniref:Tripartite tricarboxylate transporter TctB family protein n=1 Tax=Acuticoccus mangrovi TaxID=2796142 RepID=A0A934IQ95_9HYPH|nr:tripartite tricarboxylate transporter TctB family protein [Acuticoccus mangrovi]MBJ3776633.1 tripartite tricarboxylate transporter TctB family protein [Acuticoccus mangrovi]